METNQRNRISKFLSLILRHAPEKIGLELDENGWADVEELVAKAAQNKMVFSRADLEEVVATNDKQRFGYNEDKSRIRASQGHSIDVELQLETKEPPETLYHGTVPKYLGSIRREGLRKMSRHHVHLSGDRGIAEKVGNRRGEAVILVVRSKAMYNDGFAFFISANGVWLTDHVPIKYIEFQDDEIQ
jgi:putative RNA 2'-phosphotransferase